MDDLDEATGTVHFRGLARGGPMIQLAALSPEERASHAAFRGGSASPGWFDSAMPDSHPSHLTSSASALSPQRRERYGVVGWTGFFALCLVGLGLPLIFVSWLGGPEGKRFTMVISRLAGSLVLIACGAAFVLAIFIGLIAAISS
jgi:hypothetical protein